MATITIPDLTPRVTDQLNALATRAGTNVESYVRHLLEKHVSMPEPMHGYEGYAPNGARLKFTNYGVEHSEGEIQMTCQGGTFEQNRAIHTAMRLASSEGGRD